MVVHASSDAVTLGSTLLNLGTGVIVGGAVVFLWSIAWLYRTKFKDLKALLLIAMALVMMPYGVKLVQEKTGWFTKASSVLLVENLQVVNIEQGEVMVYFTTPSEVIAYLEYTDNATGLTKPYLPLYPIAKTSAHAIPVSEVGPRGGTIIFVMDGQKVGLQGKPVEIR